MYVIIQIKSKLHHLSLSLRYQRLIVMQQAGYHTAAEVAQCIYACTTLH